MLTHAVCRKGARMSLGGVSASMRSAFSAPMASLRGREGRAEGRAEGKEVRDEQEAQLEESMNDMMLAGAQFTCFTGTKVQMLTPGELHAQRPTDSCGSCSTSCFTGTKVQILTPEELHAQRPTDSCGSCSTSCLASASTRVSCGSSYSVYLLY